MDKTLIYLKRKYKIHNLTPKDPEPLKVRPKVSIKPFIDKNKNSINMMNAKSK